MTRAVNLPRAAFGFVLAVVEAAILLGVWAAAIAFGFWVIGR